MPRVMTYPAPHAASTGARVYLTTIVSLAGVALATWFGMQAGATGPGRRW
jgi:hypothetical protein